MNIRLHNGLPIVTLTLTLHDLKIKLPNVLFDTGCAATIFDTDLLAPIGIQIDFIHGKAKRMYGVGGTSEVCYEQIIPHLKIEHVQLETFPVQLGSVQEPYGFDGILGIDFMMKAKSKVDFETMRIHYSE
ncbi:aspartyl protease family protein [Paenibacillus cymbidii]|uniref:aspartyl protease family protein n=1 Tax=Paenibacillus cymbidii TaxID=1639034 RepID=UPI0010801A0C|nr:aspartyl protease family protein [Paenibacillus cymbidii]